jgi:hypothetical protein
MDAAVISALKASRAGGDIAAGLPSRSSRAAPAFAQGGSGAAAFTRFASETGWLAEP